MSFKTKISIKIPIPKWKETHQWGDYHMGQALKREFENEGFEVIIQTLSEWYNGEDDDCDVVIVLRGLTSYNTRKKHFNIMWNISHPDMVIKEEYNQYDHVFIASELWANKIREMVNVPVTALLQCTDPELFYHDYDGNYAHELLFVGNSRNVYRKIIKDLLPTTKDLSIYGADWRNYVDEKYITGKHIPNNELRKAYSSCKILLNDHWDDMREKGFISNRLFDGFATGTFIISDNIKGASDVFEDALVTYSNPEELKNLVNYYLENDNERKEKGLKGAKIVNKHHTYSNRVKEMVKVIKSNISPKIYLQNSDLIPEVYVDKLWKTLIFPIINNIKANDMVVIGSKQLALTKKVLEYCQDNQNHLTLITSSLNKKIESIKKDYNDYLEILTGNNIINLPKLKSYDIIFLEGNRDFHTINNELKIIETEFKDKTLPIIFIHNFKHFYNPTNQQTYNKTEEHSKDMIRAVEDYINDSESDLSYMLTEAYHGLIIIYSGDGERERMIEDVFSKKNILKSLEEERQKFVLAYNGSKSLINNLETKLIEKKIDLEQTLENKTQEITKKDQALENKTQEMANKLRYKDIQLKRLKIQLESQIDASNRLIKDKKILTETIHEYETQIKKLNNEFDILTDNIIEMRYHSGKDRPLTQKLISIFPSLYILSMMNKTGFKISLIYLKAYYTIKKNKLFDIGFYLNNYQDVQLSGQDPLLHYLYYGFREGRLPNRNFDGDEYIETHGDLKDLDINPLVHYCLYGIKEGRNSGKNGKKNP